jgi:quinol monooxygenase YgiN
MYGSITRLTAKPGLVDEAVAAWRAAWAGRPAVRGSRHTYLLVDRPRGELVVVGLWDDAGAAGAFETSPEVERVRAGLRPSLDADALADRRVYEVAEVL